jgi:serine/threonine-protein kinase ULK/ATG1
MDQKKKVGNYLLVSKVGQGQFGVVYKGVLIEDQKKVYAIKCIQKSKLEGNSILNRLFQTEMSVMSKLNHPNIMHLYEFMETAHNYYLVIQFCNNGDLESYLKKMGKLSEEEAVYFLMQIMNGFQVLHKNKIMHRDVKLANIFLQDDKVVIGDFGFAKQGVDVTRTKLGTPITMAPELLSSNGNSYTSKADLWSIGVCFYQMLFGKTPFDAKSYDDLKDKVKTQSGKRLIFPKDTPISEQCKDLLINLMQYDANLRIEWKDFFNHALFELHSNHNKNKIDDITKSMFDRQNEETVKKEFTNNKKNVIDNITLENPENMKQDDVAKNKTEEGNVKDEVQMRIEEEQSLEENFRLIRARYCHEKKKVIFLMYAVRKIRNLAKLKNVFGEMTDSFMYGACILLKKGLLMNYHAIQSLKLGDNIFKLKDFNKFLQTDENVKIQKNFEEDEKIYQTFSQQMNAKLREEVISVEYKQNMKTFNTMGFNDLPSLDQGMLKLMKYFKDKLNFLKMDATLEADYCLAIVHFYYSIFCEDTFAFIQNNKIFEWKTFENDCQAENAKRILKDLVL